MFLITLREWRTVICAATFAILFVITAGGAAIANTSAGPSAPQASAGADRTVVIGQTVTLDGTGSTDLDGDRLRYEWKLSTPAGSAARLTDSASPRPRFTVDTLGDYVAVLTVHDAHGASAPSRVRVSTGNVAPIADPGPNRTIAVGQSIMLDAGASFDANGDALSFRWTLVEAPAGSRAAIADSRASVTTFHADVDGDYVLALHARDDRLESAAAHLVLSTRGSAPAVDAGVDRRVAAGADVHLDAWRSSDADGDPLRMHWSLLHAPAGSNATLASASGQPLLRTDLPGLYVAQLMAADAASTSAPDTVVIEAFVPAVVWAARSAGAADTDGDGIPDVTDNCVEEFNPTQLDTNGDGFGNRCDADLDNDGFITNVGDLGLLRLAYFSTPASPNWNPDADFNGDLVVNVQDLGIMRNYFFGPPGPIAITFINPAGGDWHDPLNWMPAVVPDTRYSVRIDLDPGMVVEYSTGASTIAGLRASSPLLFSGGELRVHGEVQFNDAVTMQGGFTLEDANILAPTAMPAPVIDIPISQQVTFDGVTLAQDVNIARAATLTAENDLTLDGATISIASESNSFTTLAFSGASGSSSTFGGTGDVVFNGTSSVESRNRIIASGTMHGLIIGSGITVRSGTLGGSIAQTSANGPITILGTLIANVSGDQFQVNGFPLTLDGSTTVSNSAIFEATFGGVGSSIAATATIDVNDAEIELFGDFANNGTITVTNSTLDIGNAVGDEWSNAGTITLNNATLELGGTFMLADVGNMAGTGTTIINGTFDNSGQTVDLFAALPGTVEFGSGATVLGGTLNGGALLVPLSQNVTFDGVTLGADLTIERAATLTAINDLTLSGATISIASESNSFTTLAFSGASGASSTLGGTGEVVFNGTSSVESRNRIIASGTMHGLIIGSGITVRSGTLGGSIAQTSANGPITILGTLIANVSGDQFQVNGFPLTLDGSTTVSNSAIFEATFGGVGSSIAATATIDVNDAEIELFGDFANNGTITVTNSTLDIGNAVGDEWSNAGTITLNNATLELGGTFMLADVGNMAGTGTTIINGTFDNTGQTVDLFAALPGTVEFGSGATVLGGTLNGGALLVPLSQNVTFDGVTLGADLTIERAATLTAINDLTLSGATISIASESNSFTTLAFSGASGASSTLGGTGEVVFNGTSSVESRNRIIASGTMHGLIIGSGITVRSGTLGGSIAQTSANGPITILGTLIANVSGDQFQVNGFPLTLDGSTTVSNSAIFEATFGGVGSSIAATATIDVNDAEIELFGDFANNGTITVTNSTLDIGNAVGDEWSNAGTITLNNATLELGGTFMLADVGNMAGTGTTIINGTFDNSGQTVDLFAALPGTVEFGSGATVLGGTLNGGALLVPLSQNVTFDGVTLGADLTIERAATLTAINDLTLSGATISIASESNSFTTLAFSGASGASSTLGGTGEVVFNGTSSVESRNRIIASGTMHGLIIGSGITVRSGTLGGSIAQTSANGPITILGTLIANVSGDQFQVNGFPLTLDGSTTVSNSAIFEATFGGVGSSIAATATIDVNDAEIELFGDFANNGTITVTNSTLDIGNAVGDEWSNAGTITLNNATLELGGTFMLADVGNMAGTGTTIINGTFDNTGQTVDLFAALPGTVEFGSGATVLGGTLNGGALLVPLSQNVTFDGVTLGADLTIERAATLTAINDLTLSGATISIASESNSFTTLAFSGASGASSTLGGTGVVEFNGTSSVESRNRIAVVSSGHGLTVASGVTIRTGVLGGAVTHTSSNGPITIEGTVIADSTTDSLSMSAGTLTISGTLRAGAGGTFLMSDYTLSGSATVEIDIGGNAASDFGKLDDTNATANLAGTLDLNLVNGFSPLLGDTFEIVTFNARNGTFGTVNGTAIGGGLSFQVNYNPIDVTLEVIN